MRGLAFYRSVSWWSWFHVPKTAQWIMSTTGDGTWTFVNADTGELMDVYGHSTDDGAKVSMWTPTSKANQRWSVTDET